MGKSIRAFDRDGEFQDVRSKRKAQEAFHDRRAHSREINDEVEDDLPPIKFSTTYRKPSHKSGRR